MTKSKPMGFFPQIAKILGVPGLRYTQKDYDSSPFFCPLLSLGPFSQGNPCGEKIWYLLARALLHSADTRAKSLKFDDTRFKVKCLSEWRLTSGSTSFPLSEESLG